MLPITRKLMLIFIVIYLIPMFGWYVIVDYIEYANQNQDPLLKELILNSQIKLGIILILGICVLGIIFKYLNREIIKPLNELTKKAEKISTESKSRDFQTTREDEIGKLSNSLSNTLKHLEDKISYISEFASNISHEFKMPLSSIRGSIELLIDGADKEQKIKEDFYQNILRSTERLDIMISDLIELNHLDNDTNVFKMQKTDYVKLLKKIFNDFLPFSKQKNITIEFENNLENTIELIIDENKLTQVFVNIIENAISAINENGQIKISLSKEEKNIITKIYDNGTGIPEDIKEKVFNRFFSTRKGFNNSGLGLSIAKTIIEKHKGSITISDNTPKGSIFIITLPYYY